MCPTLLEAMMLDDFEEYAIRVRTADPTGDTLQ